MWKFAKLLPAILIALSAAGLSLAEERGTVTGTVKDAQTGTPLPGAAVQVKGTGLGASSDVDGRFIIRNVSAGSLILRAVYVGYHEKELTVAMTAGETCKLEFRLSPVGIESEEVVVTAQATGQKEAINQQLSALPIVNVVSRARIQELPDANAAESVARLPGVSLIRTGGEGSKVVIRGLSPQYNQITIDGVEMPSDVTSANNIYGDAVSGSNLAATGDRLGDRANDLSMVSSNMLGGIKVTKAITPDMDAAVLGGVVDFDLRKAARTEPGVDGERRLTPMVEFKAHGGYTGLKQSYNNYNYTGSVEQRFFDQSFGVFVQGSAEKRNLSSNVLGVNYTLIDRSHGDAPLPRINDMNLSDVFRLRERFGGTMVLDYQHEKGEIALMNFLSRSKTQEIVREESMYPWDKLTSDGNLIYDVRESNNQLDVISNLLSIKQEISVVHADVRLSHSYSETQYPEDLYADFAQVGSLSYFVNRGGLTGVEPKMLASWVTHDPLKTVANNFWTYTERSSERTLTASLDLSSDVALTTLLSGSVKLGGTFQHRTREYNIDAWVEGPSLIFPEQALAATTFLAKDFPWLIRDASGRLTMLGFLPDSYQYGEFLNGDYALGQPINVNRVWQVLHRLKQEPAYRFDPSYYANVINNYSGYENKSAAYAMLTLNLGQEISLIPGVRYQNLTTNYAAPHGALQPNSSHLVPRGDTTIEHSHGYLLPMVHVRYSPTDWLQFHFAYTNTLNYPDYSTITPRYVIFPVPGTIDYNNRDLKPATSENLDLMVAFHSNAIGLLSVDGFKKRIKDLVFFSHTYISDLSGYPALPQGGKQLYTFNTYINNPIAIDLYGIEAEWQTHFWYLPKPFDGLVLNVNYTHIFSEARYPRSDVTTIWDDEGNQTQWVTDTSYAARMLNQPNDIVNLAIGYDYRGFSLRVSMLYQDNVFKRPDFWLQQRINSAKYTRWDLTVKQDLPWLGAQVFVNLMNITGENDIDINQKNLFPANEQRYGMAADVGVQIRL
jgi:TonB-dependent receptor